MNCTSTAKGCAKVGKIQVGLERGTAVSDQMNIADGRYSFVGGQIVAGAVK